MGSYRFKGTSQQLMLRGLALLAANGNLKASAQLVPWDKALEKSATDGRPVLVLMSGSYHHAAVLSGYDRTRLYLFDSSGFQWVALQGVGLPQARTTKRHQVNGKYMFALSTTPRA